MNAFTIRYSAASCEGRRENNEDNFLIHDSCAPVAGRGMYQTQGIFETDRCRVAAVCDGIGGGTWGSTAALFALKTIEAAASEYGMLPPEKLVLVLAEAAQKTIQEFYGKLDHQGGCTLSLAVVREDRWAYLNIGDSPGFLWKKVTGEITELSQRHNLKHEKLRRGIVPNYGDSCRLYHYLGKPGCAAGEMAHVTQGTLEPGDSLLLCSDGVTNAYEPGHLGRFLEQGTAAEDMVMGASGIPMADNCTAVWMRAVDPDCGS